MVAKEIIPHQNGYFSENGFPSTAMARLCDCNLDDVNLIESKYIPRAHFEKTAQKSII